MRISYWSSDVCSSDLLIPNLPLLNPAIVGLVQIMVEQVIGEAEEHPAILAVQHNREADLSVGDHHDARDRPEDAAAVLDDAVAAIILHVPAERIGQIGRASCRERVCQYG